jgi:RimJ/RimL family protein N-acetyltransferase
MNEITDNLQRNYKIFIEGETINLCLPSEDAIYKDGWADWFNDIPSLQNSVHGVFPNFVSNQLAVLNGVEEQKIVALLICRKTDNIALGIVSMQQIDLSFRQAEIAIMLGEPKKLNMPSISALEAMALITKHGFCEMGLQRIYAGLAFPSLAGWNKMLEIIGFQTDGLARESFRRGHKYTDTALISCLYSDYCKLNKYRSSYWPGAKEIMKLIRKQPKQSYAEKVATNLQKIREEHFVYLFE